LSRSYLAQNDERYRELSALPPAERRRVGVGVLCPEICSARVSSIGH